MEEKSFSVVKRHRIYNIISWLGVIIAVVGYFLGGTGKAVLPWVGLALVVLAVIYRFTQVRCPHCGNHLTEGKSIPARCPECHKELN